MTDIYGTLGPACAGADTLEQMLRRGMTGVRLNLSHMTLTEAAPLLCALREAAARCGKRPKLLIDMQGPELRVGALERPLTLAEGEIVSLGDGLPMPRAVLDGAASVMVTGETAVGEYPVETIGYLTRTVREAERFLPDG